jgi:hypothetical protein
MLSGKSSAITTGDMTAPWRMQQPFKVGGALSPLVLFDILISRCRS